MLLVIDFICEKAGSHARDSASRGHPMPIMTLTFSAHPASQSPGCTHLARLPASVHHCSHAFQAVSPSFQVKQRRLVRRSAARTDNRWMRTCRAHQLDDRDHREAVDKTFNVHTACTSVLVSLVLLAVGWPEETQAAVQHLPRPETWQLATGEGDFWVNVSRYGRYFITVLLGTAYISVKPVLQLLKRPKTAVAVIVGLVALYLFVSTTVQAMLGVSNPLDYQPSGFFPDNY